MNTTNESDSRVINSVGEDYHMHSSAFSDGLMTISELISASKKAGKSVIYITDHSDATAEFISRKGKPFRKHPMRKFFTSGREDLNLYEQNIEVHIGVEADIINSDGEICTTIHQEDNNFIVLSLHPWVYTMDSENPGDELKTINEAYRNAIEKYHERIDVLGHPCISSNAEFLDIKQLVELANQYNIPMEVNGSNLLNDKTHMPHLAYMVKHANKLIVNSDAHTLKEVHKSQKHGFEVLFELLNE